MSLLTWVVKATAGDAVDNCPLRRPLAAIAALGMLWYGAALPERYSWT